MTLGDGLELILDDDTWLLMRASGSEPVMRIYAESVRLVELREPAGEARGWVV